MVGRWKNSRIVFITPFPSRSVIHVKVLKRKFIHMGRIKSVTIYAFFLSFMLASIMPRGYDRRKHTKVLIRASSMDLIRALKYPGFIIVATLSNVNLPAESVKP